MQKFKIVIPLTFFIVLVLFAGYRYFYGLWNPFVSPDRIECYGRRYYISHNSPRVLNEEEKPLYPIKSLNILTGKRLYTSQPKGEFVPAVIFLDIGNGRFIKHMVYLGDHKLIYLKSYYELFICCV
jgi:hypothetical protein